MQARHVSALQHVLLFLVLIRPCSNLHDPSIVKCSACVIRHDVTKRVSGRWLPIVQLYYKLQCDSSRNVSGCGQFSLHLVQCNSQVTAYSGLHVTSLTLAGTVKSSAYA